MNPAPTNEFDVIISCNEMIRENKHKRGGSEELNSLQMLRLQMVERALKKTEPSPSFSIPIGPPFPKYTSEMEEKI